MKWNESRVSWRNVCYLSSSSGGGYWGNWVSDWILILPPRHRCPSNVWHHPAALYTFTYCILEIAFPILAMQRRERLIKSMLLLAPVCSSDIVVWLTPNVVMHSDWYLLPVIQISKVNHEIQSKPNLIQTYWVEQKLLMAALRYVF